jgi:hypothetical protein
LYAVFRNRVNLREDIFEAVFAAGSIAVIVIPAVKETLIATKPISVPPVCQKARFFRLSLRRGYTDYCRIASPIDFGSRLAGFEGVYRGARR